MRPSLSAVPDEYGEPGQILRLARFRRDHPQVAITCEQFRVWQAVTPLPDGEAVSVRDTLEELLDKLDGTP